MKISFRVVALNPYGANVQVNLQPEVEGAPPGTPAPQPLVIFMTPSDGDELELGETFSVEVKPDKP